MPSQPRNPLQRWLKKHPQPTLIRCYNADGDETVVRVGVTSSKWRDACESCEKYAKLEAMNDANQVLRTYETETEIEEVKKGAAAAFDPETHRLEHFATLLSQAHDKGYVVVDKLTELVDRLLQRNAQVEAAWQKLLSAHANQILRQAQVTGEDDGEDMIKAALPALLPIIMKLAGGESNGAPQPKG